MHEERVVVVFSGGGTGGHLYPALALADAVRELRPDVDAVFVGAERGIESRVLPERGEDHVLLPVQGVHRGELLSNWTVVPALARSLWSVYRLFRARHPKAVVVTGGYAGGPAGIAAGAFRVPLLLQEQNAVPGVTIKVLARWATRVHVAFPEAAEHLPEKVRDRVRETGNPIRPAETLARGEACGRFGIPEEATVLLVVGGSQGSRALNRALLDAVTEVQAGGRREVEDLHILWSTGPSHLDEVREGLAEAGDPEWVHARGYIDDMPAALATADVALSRAGAMGTAELLNQGLPAILVPLPTAAADHQTKNARALEQGGAAVMLEEDHLDAGTLWGRVGELVRDDELRREMAEAARERSRPEATRRIAEDIVTLLPPAVGAA